MARTLSQDLRDRVIAAIDGGMSCRAAAVHFGGQRIERDPLAATGAGTRPGGRQAAWR